MKKINLKEQAIVLLVAVVATIAIIFLPYWIGAAIFPHRTWGADYLVKYCIGALVLVIAPVATFYFTVSITAMFDEVGSWLYFKTHKKAL